MTDRRFQVQRDGSEVTVSVDVPQDAICTKERELLATARASLRVPGFRPGKAPEHLVLRHYGESEFVQDLKDDLVREWVSRSLQELDLHPVTTPTVEMTEFARGERLAFAVKFAVLPEVALPDELGVGVPEPPPAEVTDLEVQGVLDGLRRDAAAVEPKTGPAGEGDAVRLERAGRDWEGEATESRPIGKQLLGAETGQRITLVDEDGHSEVFAVAGVYSVTLPSEEETARHYGHPSWEAFGDSVRGELVRIASGRRLRGWRLAVLDAVADALGVEVPPTLLSEAVSDETKEMRLRPEDRPQVTEAVRHKLRREIVAQRVAEAKGLLPDEDEVQRLAKAQGRDEGAVRGVLVLERAADWLIANARRSG